MKKVLLLIVILMVCPCVTFAQSSKKVKAIATFSILGDVVKQVGGDYIDLTILVGSDSDAHTFEPTPQDSIVLSKAHVIFENGLHFEHFLDDLYQASGSHAKRVIVTEGIKTRTFDVLGELNEVDPHAWQDVQQVMVMVNHVKDILQELDPAHRDIYEVRAQDYLAQLIELDQWIMTQVDTIPIDQRKLVTSHDAIGYFANRYGFKVIGAVVPSATTEAEDPSAKQIAALLHVIKSAHVKAIFTENIHNAKLARAVAQDAHVRIVPALYTDALGETGSDGDSYIKMMKHNVTIIVEALK